MEAEKKLDTLFKNYPFNRDLLDEVFTENGQVRKHYQGVFQHFAEMPLKDFKNLKEYARHSSFDQGITFNVYSGREQKALWTFVNTCSTLSISSKDWQTIPC